MEHIYMTQLALLYMTSVRLFYIQFGMPADNASNRSVDYGQLHADIAATFNGLHALVYGMS